MAPRWYVIHTLTGKETKVAEAIQRQAEARNVGHLIRRVLIPTETEIRSAGGRRREIKRKLFPGYVFCEMDLTEELRQIIQQISGVTHFLGAGQGPAPLRDEEVTRILKTVGEEAAVPKAAWEAGQAVRITEGPFSEMSGKIVEVNPERETVKVQVTIFGRETPVEVGFTAIERL
ncbi:MAG: transcription termination/antitermination protein NusG [Armatimonadetes bacterium]|nr:transcription termination/antitermination protein NusG [Armatimonadota bacterium]